MVALTEVHDHVRAENAAWWAAHPELHDRKPYAHDAKDLAFSVVHWHHNVESSQRHKTELGESDRFFLRQYAISATRAWLAEAQRDLEIYPADHEHWRGYGHRDQESLIRNLQVAIDDFEWNDKHRNDPSDPTEEDLLGAAAFHKMKAARDQACQWLEQLLTPMQPSQDILDDLAALRDVGK